MNKIMVVILLMMLCLIVFGCKKNEEQEIPIEAENIENIEKTSTGENNVMKNAGEIYPISTTDYTKYILIHKSTEEYILRYINKYADLYTGTKKLYDIKYYKADENWIIIKCPDDFSFFNYHNITGWFFGDEEDKDSPDFTLVVASHNTKSTESYYACIDINSWGDTLIGVFDDGNKFSIYLPESYETKGNIKIGENSLKTIGVSDFLKELDMNYRNLLSIDDKEYKRERVEIAVN